MEVWSFFTCPDINFSNQVPQDTFAVMLFSRVGNKSYLMSFFFYKMTIIKHANTCLKCVLKTEPVCYQSAIEWG